MTATRYRILPETDDFVRDVREKLPADTLAWVDRHETTTRGIMWRALRSGYYVFVGDARKTRTAQYDDLRKTLGL